MMNVLGLCLLLTSVATAGIFSPSPTKQGASTIVKEGHRVVVVEYDQDGHQNTKISISPEHPTHDHDHDHDSDNHQFLDNTKHRIKEAASVLPNLGQGISQDATDATFMHAPKELICDAYGKCKHKIGDAMEKTKDIAKEVIHKKKEEIASTKETARHVHEYAQDSVETAKGHMANNLSEAAHSLRHLKNSINRQAFGSVMDLLHLLGFATAYGICVWVTFISSYVLSRSMPRQQFALVQSKIYPVYFRAMLYTILVSLFGHLLAHSNTLLSTRPHMFQAYNLVASLLTLFINSAYLEPRATKLMFERIKIEKEEGRGREDMSGSGERSRSGEHQRTADPKEPASTSADQDAVRSRIIKLNDKLKKLNSYSSFLNILNLMSLTWHLVYLAQRLHHPC